MATVLLSLATNTFHGISLALALGTITLRLVHPTAPVLLTKNGPLGTIIQAVQLYNKLFNKLNFAPIRSLRIG